MNKIVIRKIVCVAIAFVFAAVSAFAIVTDESTASTKNTYKLKVNIEKNVVTAYKLNDKGKYKAYRAMLCSSGKSSSPTPTGTYSVRGKWRWLFLVGNVWGQYDTQFYGNYLFHSVYYKKYGRKDLLVNEEYNKLGKAASHGCVRLSVIDAKWIYENCKQGTKVIVYRSSNPGPLGKPTGFKVSGSTGWDPLDPDPDNPDCILKGPKIDTSKKTLKTLKYGGSNGRYTIKEMKVNVKVSNPYCIQDLTSLLKVSSVWKKNTKTGKYEKQSVKTINTYKPGKYKIVYKAYYKYCGKKTAYRSFIITVKQKPAPPKPVDPDPVDPVDPVDQGDSSDSSASANQTELTAPADETTEAPEQTESPDDPVYIEE